MKTQLEVGDKIVRYHNRGNDITVYKISRVTLKRAYVGEIIELKRQISQQEALSKSYLQTIGSGATYWMYIESEHEPIIAKSKLVAGAKKALNGIDVTTLPNETLEKLIELLTPKA